MITHVAIWRNNVIYALPSPNRHHHCFQLMDDEPFEQEIQGFLDEHGNFLDRKQAFIHAVDHAQLKRNPDPKHYQGNQLFSEDLW